MTTTTPRVFLQCIRKADFKKPVANVKPTEGHCELCGAEIVYSAAFLQERVRQHPEIGLACNQCMEEKAAGGDIIEYRLGPTIRAMKEMGLVDED